MVVILGPMWMYVWVVMQVSSLASLMEELQTVYNDDTAAEMYALRVPVVGHYLSLLVVYIAQHVAGLHTLLLQDKAIINVKLCPRCCHLANLILDHWPHYVKI